MVQVSWKVFIFHVIEIVFVEMDWVEVGKKKKSKLVINVFIELEKEVPQNENQIF